MKKTKNIDFLNSTLSHILIILLVGTIIYLNSLNVPFTFDDKSNIVNNPVIKNIYSLLDAAQLQGDILDPRLKPLFASRIVGYITFFLNYKVHGLSVFGYHLVNIFIHLLNSILVYSIVKLLLKKNTVSKGAINNKIDASYRLAALFSAILFVCHPIQTQAVTYIVQRFTSLATLFYLVAVTGYLQYRLSAKSSRTLFIYLSALASAVLAMKTKEFSFTLPFILTLIDFMFIESALRERIRGLWPFYLLCAIIPLTLFTVADIAGNSVNAASFEFGSSADMSRVDYFITQLTVIVKYLGLLLPPVIQNLDYDYPLYHSFFELKVLGSAAVLGALFSLGIYLSKVSQRTSLYSNPARMISFGIFWFFITIAPESSIIRIKDLIFEHRLYLPSIGLFISVTCSVLVLKNVLLQKESLLAKLITPCTIFIICLFSFATYARNIVWQDEIRLWQDTVMKSPKKPRAHNGLATAFNDSGLYNEALTEYLISKQLKPDHVVNFLIGNIYVKQKRYEDAINEFNASIKLKPDYEMAQIGICNVYYQQKDYAKAKQACESALKLKNNCLEAYNNLGLIAFEQGDVEGALKKFNTAISYKPDAVIAHNNAGNAYYKLKKYEEALNEYRKVYSLDRNYIGVHLSVGKIYHDTGRFNDAVREFQLALQQKPDFPEAANLLEISKRELAQINSNK